MTPIPPSHTDVPSLSRLWLIRLISAVYAIAIVKSIIDGLSGAGWQSPLSLGLTFIQVGSGDRQSKSWSRLGPLSLYKN